MTQVLSFSDGIQMNSAQKRSHLPVLFDEVLEMALTFPDAAGVVWDGTFGRGGHTQGLLNKYPHIQVLATDRDPQALSEGAQLFPALVESSRLILKHFNFHDLAQGIKVPGQPDEGFDSVLLDLGVSSPQLDQAERGFSFYHDGPLDMRMDPSHSLSAADIVNTWSENDLNYLFQTLGEIPRPQKVVSRIVEDRKKRPFETTLQLAGLVERTFGWRQKGKHPATNFFLALRLEVNEELTHLEDVLRNILSQSLKPNGRLLVITFHSSEDRIVKNLFKSSTHLGKNLTKKVIPPKRSEILLNPRSRSAKLRVFQFDGGMNREKSSMDGC